VLALIPFSHHRNGFKL